MDTPRLCCTEPGSPKCKWCRRFAVDPHALSQGERLPRIAVLRKFNSKDTPKDTPIQLFMREPREPQNGSFKAKTVEHFCAGLQHNRQGPNGDDGSKVALIVDIVDNDNLDSPTPLFWALTAGELPDYFRDRLRRLQSANGNGRLDVEREESGPGPPGRANDLLPKAYTYRRCMYVIRNPLGCFPDVAMNLAKKKKPFQLCDRPQ
jgi:hypothetical protein